ncbi:hypothetical protein AAZX31_14G002700 [Glycine max]|uniref:RING-CH-type domain-containing protein n=2 Tax=Glycine subgen. Soja TaxID=1462606 RepID=A0A0R0G768_SOYBN|nr:uncharacterized protein LOC100798208 isoform X3 [Glycine max]XP_028198614.1 uncharacterized protein LOC114383195 isoform X2 [Glycine soja]|eukprot:XP_006595644.1 uncharacterized protein LOC100798208 isoform X2 [Glycine max]
MLIIIKSKSKYNIIHYGVWAFDAVSVTVLPKRFLGWKIETCTGNEKSNKASRIPQSRRPNLSSLQIPAWSLDIALSTFAKTDGPSVSRSSPGSTRGLPPRPNSAKVRSSMRGLLPQRSFKINACSQDIERTGLIVPNTPPSDAPLDKPSTSTSLSLNNRVISPSTKVSHSLPVTPFATSSAENEHGRHLGRDSDLSTMEVHQHMTRSFSVPVDGKATNLRVTDSRGLIRVISAKRHLETVGGKSTDGAFVPEIAIEDATEDIPEEQAVCRICLVELGEGGNTLKMECSCKGDLALAHQECAVKWFSIKGNRTCDVCKLDVQNLPVTLLKIYNPLTPARQASNVPQQSEIVYYRIWQDVPVLILVSMLAYFCFLEQLLVSDLGPRALAISLPFSCVLGLLSSMIASTMVSRSFVWAYACFQFATLILLAHVFYTILNFNAILSILLSTFTGFGIAISMNSLVMEFIGWRTSRQVQSSFVNVNWTEQQHREHVQEQGQEDGGQHQRQRQQEHHLPQHGNS